MHKHSTTPWKIEFTNSDAHNAFIKSATGEAVATVHRTGEFEIDKPFYNAALLGAAPDLYEVLKQILAHGITNKGLALQGVQAIEKASGR